MATTVSSRAPGALPPRPPLDRFDLLLRYGFALGVMAFLWMPLVIPRARYRPEFYLSAAAEVLFGLVALRLMRDRRRLPRAVSILTALCCFPSTGALGPALVAYCSVVTTRRWRQIVIPAALIMLASLFNGLRFSGFDQRTILGLVGNGAALVLVTILGLYEATRADLDVAVAERAAEAERAEQARLAEARAGERERIAREMHDVLAHRISLVAMHAGALSYRDDLTPTETKETALLIQENAARSLDELRVVLRRLRDVGEGDGIGVPAAPQPALADLPVLVAEATGAGQDVAFTSSIDPDAVPDRLGRHVFRIVQEGLTNARKHAPAAPVRVVLGGRSGDRLTVDIRNVVDAGVPAGDGARLGLVGLAERVASLGGELTEGRVGDEFVLTASIPWTQ